MDLTLSQSTFLWKARRNLRLAVKFLPEGVKRVELDSGDRFRSVDITGEPALDAYCGCSVDALRRSPILGTVHFSVFGTLRKRGDEWKRGKG